MSIIEHGRIARAIRFAEAYGVFAFGPDDAEFRTGSLSGSGCVISDPERRGLLGSIIKRLLAGDGAPTRPWNAAEMELLEEIIPQLEDAGIVEANEAHRGVNTRSVPLLRKPMTDAHITLVGHGVLGEAIRQHLAQASFGSITMIESSSVAKAGTAKGVDQARSPAAPRPQDANQWLEFAKDSDWIVAAQDCFEPGELTAINSAALQCSTPWSLVCLDGYEGWLGPTFVPGETACFNCFSRRLLAGAGEIRHIFMDPGVKVYKVPSPWSVGPESSAWIGLLASMFALELIAAIQGRSFTLNNILIVHRLNLTFQRESVLRLPRCPDCSPRGDAPVQNVFSHALSTYRDGR